MAQVSADEMDALLSTPAPAIDAGAIDSFARRHYFPLSVVRPLTSERDQNFHLRSADETEFVLKISNRAEDPEVTNFQTSALRHLARTAPTLPLQRVIPTRTGDFEVSADFDGHGQVTVRLLSYLPGVPLSQFRRSAHQRRNLGGTLARIAQGLSNFTHPAADHVILWDVNQASLVRRLLDHIGNQAAAAEPRRVLDRFEAETKPALASLRAQVIHNDLNPYNVLVTPVDPDEIVGVLDFGDMVRGPLICDLAVAASYHVPQGLLAVGELIGGYDAVTPLTRDELLLLANLIATRLVLTIAITGWRARRYPANRDYILRNNPAAWAGLELLRKTSEADFLEAIERACGSRTI